MDDRTKGVTDEAATDHRTKEIRAEIQQTRDDMSQTIDAIQEKLRPGNVVADATERVKDATTEKVRHMAYRASDAADRQTLLPAALIGIGTAWLLMNRSKGDSYQDGRYDGGSNAWRNRNRESSADETFRAVGTYGSDFRETDVSGLAGRATERAGEMGEQARAAVRQTSRRAQNQLQRAINNNPLAVGAAAVVLGAAVGLALPETERENEWMGEARDTVVDKAQNLARSAADRVKDAASDAVASTITGSSND